MFFYWAYGLEIVSELEFPEMYPYAVKKPDLEIKFGKVPAALTGPEVVAKEKFFITPTEYLIHLPICSYYVKEGTSITIELKEHADLPSVRLFLLTNAMAAVLHQRNKVALHAGAIQTDKGLVVICGESGAGKSTTISALQKRGYRVFSDDVILLEQKNTNSVFGIAAYPTIKLWNDSIEKLEINNEKDIFKIRDSIEKFGIPFKNEFTVEPIEIITVIHLCFNNKNETSIYKLKGINAFETLIANLYQTSQLNNIAKSEKIFNTLQLIAQYKSVFQIKRSNEFNSISQLVDIIIKIIEQ